MQFTPDANGTSQCCVVHQFYVQIRERIQTTKWRSHGRILEHSQLSLEHILNPN
uniref:Uncharacterized protein n=1 Tax=Arundo donax TaxID=35708 RepID=A0A0A9FRT6_ARUDO